MMPNDLETRLREVLQAQMTYDLFVSAYMDGPELCGKRITDHLAPRLARALEAAIERTIYSALHSADTDQWPTPRSPAIGAFIAALKEDT